MPESIFALDLDKLSVTQKGAIQELRELIDPELTADYMKEDYYLAKWLYQKDFNVPDAISLLQRDLKWRKDEKVDTILKEDWEDMHVRFPYSRDAVDKNGHPLLFFDIGQWNISKYIGEYESGTHRLGRYIVKLHEESEAHVRRLRSEGKNITQFNILINLDGYSLQKHASLKCLYFYREIGDVLTPHFPRCVEKVVFINVPALFKLAYLFLSKENQECINIFGRDRSSWEQMLLNYIDRHQIPEGLLQDEITRL